MSPLANPKGVSGTGIGSSVRVSRVAAQSIPNNAITDISWNTEEYDTDNLWVSGTGVTIDATGLWMVQYEMAWVANTGGTRYAWIQVNSSAERRAWNLGTATSANPFVPAVGSWTGRLTAADTVRLQVFQDSGGPLNTRTIERWPALSAVRLAA